MDDTATEQLTKVTGLAFVSVYGDDYQTLLEFYSEIIGLEKAFDMGEQSCYFTIDDNIGMYLQGGNGKAEIAHNKPHSSFTLRVPSAGAMYEKLKDAGVQFVELEPMHMGNDHYWFQFYDPSGNLVEILGKK